MALAEGKEIRWIRFLEQQSPKDSLVFKFGKPGKANVFNSSFK